MATQAPPNLFRMYALVDPHLSSMRVGGIVGDTRHVAGGGYHISREDLRSHGQGSDYSIQAPADQRGNASYAAAIDISLGPKQMVTVSKRLRAAMEGTDYDPRIEPLREFIGTVDNRNVCGYNRYRTNSTSRRTGWYPSGYSESSHLWHVHLSFFREYCNDWNSILGVAEVVCGLKPGELGWKDPSDPAVKPAPEPKPKPQPAKYDAWHGTLWVVKKVQAYDGGGNRRPQFDLKRGAKVVGTVNAKKFPRDGRYFQWHDVPHAIYYPLDDGNFAHTKGGKPIRKG